VSDPLTTGCGALDAVLGGGIERGVVTQLYGPPASGKTNVALTVAAEAAVAGERVLYLDTEDLSLTRFRDIAAARADETPVAELTERLIVSEAADFDEQSEAVRDTEEFADRVGLIVLDSATGFYRLERTGEDREGETLRAVARQITHLLALAKRHDLAVLVTNQVFTDPDADRTRPLGGNTLEHWTGVVVRLERFRGGNRRATVEKHRSEPAGERARFQITDTGIEDADPQQ
jgi:DNA repair protein RadB